MVTLQAKKYMIEGLTSKLSHVLFYLDDVEQRINIYRIDAYNDSLDIKVYFDSTISGKINNLRIVDSYENILFNPSISFTKDSSKSTLLSFNIKNLEVITDYE